MTASDNRLLPVARLITRCAKVPPPDLRSTAIRPAYPALNTPPFPGGAS